MNNADSHIKGYVLAALAGAIGGGLLVTIATRAIPRMMSQIMSEGMGKMMAQMNEGGCSPAEM
jgi:hypothetical protein